MKNIVICFDGTNNQFSDDPTNVLRALKVATKGSDQVALYDPGVGTMPQPGLVSRLARRISILCGLAFGTGFLGNVADGYRYLMRTYEAGDRVFLFGFSRGAYTARALAGMIHAVGLLQPGAESLVRYAIKYWRSHRGPGSPGAALCDEFKHTMSRECPIEYLGVWDTVGSVGWINNLRTFPFTFRNPIIHHVRHAVSIDERRCMFRQNLMGRDDPEQDVKNVWFAGVHSDVGGGYDPKESGLAKLALEWLFVEAERFGLRIDDAAYEQELAAGEGPDVAGPQHNSLTLGWWVVELLPIRRYSFRDGRRYWSMSLGRPRHVLDYAPLATVAVHESVLLRMEKVPAYRPKNLPPTPDEVTRTFRIEPMVHRMKGAVSVSKLTVGV